MTRRLRQTGRLAGALALAALLLGGIALTALAGHGHPRRFAHTYPVNTVSFERPKARGPAPMAPRANTLGRGIRVRSLASLTRLLPAGVLRRTGPNAWQLMQPVAFVRGAALEMTGGSLSIGPDAFLEARAGGVIELAGVTVTGVDVHGRPLTRPTPGRGFLVARDGGRLVLRHDQIRNLGHLGVVSYGIALRRPGSGSKIVDSTIRGNYFGVFLSHAAGVTVARNRILDSRVYGIDPYGYSHDLLIAGNRVSGSGLHGIILADHVSGVRVERNAISGAGGNGIVLFHFAHDNLVQENRVGGTFDGIVVTDSSRNRLVRNAIDGVRRFGVRISGLSGDNLLRETAVSGALLAVYLYGSAHDTSVLDSRFGANGENVRVRADALRIVVRPKPPLSELP